MISELEREEERWTYTLLRLHILAASALGRSVKSGSVYWVCIAGGGHEAALTVGLEGVWKGEIDLVCYPKLGQHN